MNKDEGRSDFSSRTPEISGKKLRGTFFFLLILLWLLLCEFLFFLFNFAFFCQKIDIFLRLCYVVFCSFFWGGGDTPPLTPPPPPLSLFIISLAEIVCQGKSERVWEAGPSSPPRSERLTFFFPTSLFILHPGWWKKFCPGGRKKNICVYSKETEVGKVLFCTSTFLSTLAPPDQHGARASGVDVTFSIWPRVVSHLRSHINNVTWTWQRRDSRYVRVLRVEI